MNDRNMKISVQLSDSELRAVRRLTDERKKGPAIRKVVTDALRMAHRREVAEKLMSGELGIEAEGHEESRAADRAAAKKMLRPSGK
jgi:hypothetical protein